MVLQLSDSQWAKFRNHLSSVHINFTQRCLDIFDPNRSRPVHMLVLLIYVTECIYSLEKMNICYVIWSNIMWKSVNLNFALLSLNLTQCSALQTDIETRYPGPDSTVLPFGSASAAWCKTVIPEN